MCDCQLADSLKQLFGFSEFRPGQEEACRSILDGNDTLAVMPTGSDLETRHLRR